MNKKGFTLPELLVVIAIIGILSGVTIVAISNTLFKSRQTYYQATKNTIKIAAQKYYNDNRVLLPTNKGETGEVTVQTLVDFKYLDIVKDHTKKRECNQTASKVIVTRKSSEKYDYKVILKCDVSDDLLNNEE